MTQKYTDKVSYFILIYHFTITKSVLLVFDPGLGVCEFLQSAFGLISLDV